MINQIKNIPITEDSYPVTRAYVSCHFDERGYVEEEYFMYGTANVYENRDEKPVVKFADAPYINRFLVRRPADISKASGRVGIEILNATSGVDIDRTWVLIGEEMMRNGDVYIGITSKPSSLRPLRKVDPERYGELYWSNPNPERLPMKKIADSAGMGALEQDSEMGLFWDMLTDLTKAVRAGGAFLGGIAAKNVYLLGWSQSCGYIIEYVNMFAEQAEKGIFDGYFAAGGVRMFTPGLNQYEENRIPGEIGNVIKFVHVPYVMMQTESENADLGNGASKLADSDGPDLMVRTYEVPGATHDNWYSMVEYYGDAEDEFRVGIVLDYPGEEPYPNDFPYQFAFRAAYAQLYKWAEEGIAPIHTAPIPLDFAGRNMRDRFGNAMGGFRLPPIDLPVCTYYPHCTPIMPFALTGKTIFGYRIPYTADQLRDLYGSLAAYEEKAAQKADECIKAGTLLESDKEACIRYCVEEARSFGLM